MIEDIVSEYGYVSNYHRQEIILKQTKLSLVITLHKAETDPNYFDRDYYIQTIRATLQSDKYKDIDIEDEIRHAIADGQLPGYQICA
jgi:3-dehydroquinate dehydratase